MPRVLLLGIVALLQASTARAEWVRVESPAFVVFGEIGEQRTREYAAAFERFREALGRVVAGTPARPATPTLVFIFKDAQSFAPYRPRFNGEPVEVSGYYAGGPSLDVIMLPATNHEAALRTIYHEYSHLVTASATGRLPAWLGEGLAEYYSTFEVRDEGRRALLGGVIPRHLLRLNAEGLLPLEQLLAVEHDSPLYNEGARRSTFYAQSWALVHMLRNGDPDRANQLERYVRLTASGRAPVLAWQEVFGEEKIGEQLRRYIRQGRMKGYLFTFDRPIAPASFRVTVPEPADVLGALGDLRLHVAPETAAAHISSVPSSGYATAIRGLLKLAENDADEARPLLLQAAQAPDWLVAYRAAVGLERIATSGVTEAHREAGRVADAALVQVLEARPDLPHAIALRALIAGPGDNGLALIQRARELAPGRAHYAIWQAQFHSTRAEFSQARALLAPLTSQSFPPETREYARSALSHAVAAEEARQRAARSQAPSGERPAHGAPVTMRSHPAGTVVLLFRELQPGEQRIDVHLERIECPRDGVVLHVRSGERPLRFFARQLDAIEFLSHRDDLLGPMQCGPRTPADTVYLTFRLAQAAAGFDGMVVAVEFRPR